MESNINNEQTESLSTHIQNNSEIKTKFELTIESIKQGNN